MLYFLTCKQLRVAKRESWLWDVGKQLRGGKAREPEVQTPATMEKARASGTDLPVILELGKSRQIDLGPFLGCQSGQTSELQVQWKNVSKNKKSVGWWDCSLGKGTCPPSLGTQVWSLESVDERREPIPQNCPRPLHAGCGTGTHTYIMQVHT